LSRHEQGQRAADEVVDWEHVGALRRMCARSRDRDRWPELVGMFLQDAHERAGALGEAVDAGDSELACELAHSLKGSSATFGAPVLLRLSTVLEQLAREGDMHGASDLVRVLTLECDRVESALAPTATARKRED